MNNTTASAIFHEEEDANTNLAYSLGFSFAVLLVLMIVCCISYKCSRSWSSSPHAATTAAAGPASSPSLHPTHSIFIRDGAATSAGGVDEAVLDKYPKFSYSQAKVVRAGDESIYAGCSICLADYRDSDMLRLLPECGHLFHIRCIDPWLKLRPTCPLCRSSPMLTPLAEVVRLSMHQS